MRVKYQKADRKPAPKAKTRVSAAPVADPVDDKPKST
jgi:hypothetical protein